ncbi:MAG: spermidine synthase [Candidatus Omnitrophica bacterium 4484_171]|nr:MAG: spermidine synthase [Candidatus Omnitrophica bacterium 4484_171]
MWFYESLYPDIKIGVKGKIIHRKKTPYQDMQLYSTPRFGKMLTLDGAIQTTEADEFIYHEMLTHPAMITHPNPKNILIIGGGDGGALREVLKYKIKKVYLVEIDKDVINISKKYLDKICQKSFHDKRLNIVIDDGAKFIKNTKERFDIVIVDSPDPIGPAKILFSKSFYSRVNSILTSKGIMIRQSGSTTLQADELKSSYKTLKKIFPVVEVQLAAIPTYIGGFFSFIIASKGTNPKKLNVKDIKKRINKLRLRTKYYNPEVHTGSMGLPGYVRRLLG